MPAYEIAKDLIIPLVSPLIAAGAIILAFRVERGKLAAQQEHSLKAAVESARREVLQLREAYQLIGLYHAHGQSLEAERLAAFDESAKRLFKVLHNNAQVYEEYFAKNKVGIVKHRLPLLFHELEVKLSQVKAATRPDEFILFALYLLLYARTGHRQDSEELEILNRISQSNKTFYSTWWNPA